MTTKNSRQLAREWPYERFGQYQSALRDSASRWFTSKNIETGDKGYIVKERENWSQNIILPEVYEYILGEKERCLAEKKAFPLHRYIHHGLSSQAMLFNLLGPLVTRGDKAVLKKCIKISGAKWPNGNVKTAFEEEDRKVFNEDSGQPTSIDFVVENDQKINGVYVEAKLVEQEFGSCSVFTKGDCDGVNPSQDFELCYLHFINRGYWKSLNKFEFLKTAMSSGPICLLANFYQFFREVLFALEKNGAFVLLYDERNPVFLTKAPGKSDRGLIPMLWKFVPDEYTDKVCTVTIQEVVALLNKFPNHSDWIPEFKVKYGIV